MLADRVQLQQVLSNLVLNAMEAMDPVMNGRRELAIISAQHDDKVVLECAISGSEWRISLTCIDPFFTTKPNGMGMGLAICRSIVPAHGGRLWATHATPSGSIFSFSLPASNDRVQASASRVPAS